MGVAKQRIDEAYLSQFTPLSTLSPELLDEALDHTTIERYPPGRRIFQEGEPRQRTLFLLSGQLALMSEGNPARTLKADSREAARPIDEHRAHRCTALARTSVTILSINSATLEELLRRNEDGGVMPSDPDREKQLQGALTAPLFSRLPKPHLQVLKKRLTAMNVNAGDLIIHEGDPSEYYYLIVAGRCRVTRQPGRSSRQITVAELTAGEGFGEGALI
ncbi:MAG: cyclic nucleotide-binding domain-containing protein, partial [Gammaproteobacteria bacterium]